MKRGFLVIAVSTAIVVAVWPRCGSNERPRRKRRPCRTLPPSRQPRWRGATAAPGEMKVTIDGQDQNVAGTVTCATMGGNVNIAIGEGITGIAAVVSDADPPVVQPYLATSTA